MSEQRPLTTGDRVMIWAEVVTVKWDGESTSYEVELPSGYVFEVGSWDVVVPDA